MCQCLFQRVEFSPTAQIWLPKDVDAEEAIQLTSEFKCCEFPNLQFLTPSKTEISNVSPTETIQRPISNFHSFAFPCYCHYVTNKNNEASASISTCISSSITLFTQSCHIVTFSFRTMNFTLLKKFQGMSLSSTSLQRISRLSKPQLSILNHRFSCIIWSRKSLATEPLPLYCYCLEVTSTTTTSLNFAWVPKGVLTELVLTLNTKGCAARTIKSSLPKVRVTALQAHNPEI